jgi:hypothetical protein
MLQSTIYIFLAASLSAYSFAQTTSGRRFEQTPASPEWPFGPPGSRVNLEGLLIRSDGETLSIELPDQCVIRFQLRERTRYKLEGPREDLTSFHMADVVKVESEVDGKGYLVARSVGFVRAASLQEKQEILQSPELRQLWAKNLLRNDGMDLPNRSLSIAPKPNATLNREEDGAPESGTAARLNAGRQLPQDDLIPLVRRAVNNAFESLPNIRAMQVTKLFHSASKNIKWIPDNLVAAEVAYDGEREWYSDVRIDGKGLRNSSLTADADYIQHTLDKAWSSGEFKTLSQCVFSELDDSDFHRVQTKNNGEGDLAVYEFVKEGPAICMSVLFRSQVVYPAYKGRLDVNTQTHRANHVELQVTGMPLRFPLDRAERSTDLEMVGIGGEEYLLPTTAYWFGCFRDTYSCFLNRMDFRDYRRFDAKSIVRFDDR